MWGNQHLTVSKHLLCRMSPGPSFTLKRCISYRCLLFVLSVMQTRPAVITSHYAELLLGSRKYGIMSMCVCRLNRTRMGNEANPVYGRKYGTFVICFLDVIFNTKYRNDRYTENQILLLNSYCSKYEINIISKLFSLL